MIQDSSGFFSHRALTNKNYFGMTASLSKLGMSKGMLESFLWESVKCLQDPGELLYNAEAFPSYASNFPCSLSLSSAMEDSRRMLPAIILLFLLLISSGALLFCFLLPIHVAVRHGDDISGSEEVRVGKPQVQGALLSGQQLCKCLQDRRLPWRPLQGPPSPMLLHQALQLCYMSTWMPSNRRRGTRRRCFPLNKGADSIIHLLKNAHKPFHM
ncbi:hypothetical protein MUK42_18176 [Musa troglodytarum]|uniref:Uncharacterized protein n=1 Tax=Musa troglodytarum TaxID=320322 RepID=A0A9E7HEI4_9LILI|nr:hypothetical protein MUK42_18176 [Musa troglodytarum]